MASNPAGALLFQSTRLASRVAELGSLDEHMKRAFRYSAFAAFVLMGLYLGWAARRSYPFDAPLDRYCAPYPDRWIEQCEKRVPCAPSFMIPAGETKRGTAPLWTIFYTLCALSTTVTLCAAVVLHSDVRYA